jgi:hypothetical protein
MMRRLFTLTTFTLVALASLSAPTSVLAGTALPITPDGFFADWKQTQPLHSDPVGDVSSGSIDLGQLFMANDNEALFLRFEVGRETLLQNGPGEAVGNNMRLLLDLDGSSGTGNPIEGLGAEVEIRFGSRTLQVFNAAGVPTDWNPEPLGIMGLPTHSENVFEVRIPFAAAQSQAIVDHLTSGGAIALVLEQVNGDRLPDSGTIEYVASTTAVKPVKPIKLPKKREKYFRLLTMNVERTNIEREQEVFIRILRAATPDVIAFQEIYEWTAEGTRRLVEEALPLEDDRRWEAFQVEDTVTVSSYPIVSAAGVDDNQVVHIDLPNEATVHDLVLFNAHTPCCSNNAQRDYEHDRLMVTWRELLEGRGPFPIQFKDFVIITGDLNMVGYRRQLDVLLRGEFIDSNNGPNFAPGRAKGSLKSAKLRHTHSRLVTTWRSDTSAYAPGKLDFIIYSKDVARLKRNYVIDTAEMPDDILELHGLELDDSLIASDHLAMVADFKIKKK